MKHTPEPMDLEMGDVKALQDVISRDALKKICDSFFDLFALPVRVVSTSGELLADIHQPRQLCDYINTLDGGKTACEKTVTETREKEVHTEAIVHPCFSGAAYRIVPIAYQGRALGRIIMGPYVPTSSALDSGLFAVAPSMDLKTATQHFEDMPHVEAEVAERLGDHLHTIIDLQIFAGHRARLASAMQVANVKASFRELAQQSEKLESAYEKLKELDQLKSNFLTTVSHELRTPLTSIIGYTDTLGTEAAGILNEEHMGFLRNIAVNADRLLLMIHSLLDLGQLEADNLSIQLTHVHPKDLARRAVATVAADAKEKGMKIEVDAPENLPALYVDPERIVQALSHLVGNAVKFTPNNGNITIEVRSATQKPSSDSRTGGALFVTGMQSVIFSIADSGVGIPENLHDRIFDAFFQVDATPTRAQGGAGLGLALSKKLIELHDGQIDVQSKANSGSTFVVTLPCKPAQ